MILVTGGAGFIGSNVVAALERRGAHGIAVCDRLGSGDKWRNIAKRELAELFELDEIDCFLAEWGAEIDAIIHMGAISATTETDADLIVRNNFRLSLRLWNWCADRGVRLIYASSAATYGDGARGFDDNASIEGLAMLRPMNAYGWSKHLFDRWVARRIDDGQPAPPQWVGLKFFNAYGPNEYHKGGQMSVVPQIYPHAVNAYRAPLFRSHNPDYPDGGQMRDFVWVGDCAEVILWLLDNPAVSGLFNLGTGKARTFFDLASAIYRALGQEPKIKYVDTPEAIRDRYQYFTEAPMDRLRAAGYTAPFTELEEGVTRYVRDYLAVPDPYL